MSSPIISDDNASQQGNAKRRKICRSTNNREGTVATVSRRPSTKNQEQCGIIKKIALRNVFCHEYLEFDGFTPEINLLQGANGSGKSSIVAAIVAGLGGSSRATDRGQNITGLIQHGKQWASIEIHLKNEGCNPFKEDTYGRVIIVERKIQMSGSSSYKIKSERGNIVSTKKEELNKILDRFNFQVDNPVLILSQERAKTFLSTTDPKSLFKFFMTSTQMKQWSDSILDIGKDIEISNTLVVRKRENLTVLEEELKTWQDKFTAINSLEEKRARVVQLTGAKAWAEVDEKEEELRRSKKEQRMIENRLNEIDKALEKIKNKKAQLANNDRTSNDQLVTLAEMTKDVEVKLREAKSEFDEVNVRFRRRIHEKKELEKEKLELERDIALFKEKLEKDNNAATAKWEAIISDLNKERENIQQRISGIEERKQTEESQMRNLMETLQESEREIQHLTSEQRTLEDRLRRLEKELMDIREQTDNITVYGQYMPGIISEINSASSRRQFTNKPIGPIGSYIKVKKDDWVHVIERLSNKILSSFLVSCRKDYDTLTKIFNRRIPKGAPRPQVIVAPFRDKVHDVTRFETGTDQYFSMWSIIETDNIQVANALIDQLQMESVLLIPTAKEAMALLKIRETVPQNCKFAMTLRADTIYPAPNFRIYSGNDDKSVKLLQVSVEDKVRDLGLNIESTREIVHNSKIEINEKKGELQNFKHEKDQSAQKLRKYQRDLNDCMRNLQDLKNREVPPPPDVNEIQKDLEERENKKMENKGKLNEVNNEITEEKKEKVNAEKKLQEAQKESENIRRDALKYESDAAQTKEQLIKYKKELIGYTNKAEEIRGKRNAILQTIEEQESVIERMTHELTQEEETSERISLNKSKSEIEKELNALKAIIQEKEASYGDLASVAETFREKSQKYDKIKLELNSQKQFIGTMRIGLNSRLTLIKQAKKLYQLILRSSFASMIQKRNLKGSLDIDYKTETLKILMTKDRGRDSDNSMQSLQMMSGGERSFATVSFILALWDIVTSPIRIMDEFDIFMDVVSRRQCMDMIVGAVKENSQYIMVSPLEYTVTADKLHVFRMEAPARKQVEENS